MAKLNIVKVGDDVLRKVCRPVDRITPRILTLLDDMLETMRAADGCGLAAPQVGVLRRIAVVETEPGQPIELINPKIIAYAGEQREREGCLSIPGQWGVTVRPMHVTVPLQLLMLRHLQVVRLQKAQPHLQGLVAVNMVSLADRLAIYQMQLPDKKYN